MPSPVERPVFLAASARPFSRSSRFAASRSPPASASAFLQSIIPAPVASRSALTSCALISTIAAYLSVSSSCASRVGLDRGRSLRGRVVAVAGLLLALFLFLTLELELPLGLRLRRG